jgi:hypothetical protein
MSRTPSAPSEAVPDSTTAMQRCRAERANERKNASTGVYWERSRGRGLMCSCVPVTDNWVFGGIT